MRRVLALLLLTGLMATGCSSAGATRVAVPARPAQAPMVPPPPGIATAAPNGGGTTGCRPKPDYKPTEPTAPVSPVESRVYLKEDPGIAAPILANVGLEPKTIVVEFSGPVDRETFHDLRLADVQCQQDADLVSQGVHWLSDRKVELWVGSLPNQTPGPFALMFGRGKDGQGREVREPFFVLQLRVDLAPLKVIAVPLAGGESQVLYDRRDDLDAVSVSPDGRYLLAVRKPNANVNTHSPLKVPYIIDMKTGSVRTYPVAPVEQGRWDMKARTVWISAGQKLPIDAPAPAGQDEARTAPPVLAAVSPDGRWVATLTAHGTGDTMSEADLTVRETATGETKAYPTTLGWAREAPPDIHAQWSPDSATLLLASYKEQAPAFTLLNPATMQARALPVKVGEYAIARWSPTGKYILVGKYGVVTPDGTPVLKDASLWAGNWTPDDRFLVLYGDHDDFVLLEVATGARKSLPRPQGAGHVLGFSADGSTLYLAGR